MKTKIEFDKLKLLYEENSKVTHTFWEWRHKIMNRFFVAVSAIFIVSSWMLENNKFQEYIFIPFLFGAIYSIISKKMDDVNTWILKDCYAIGNELENKLGGKNYIFGKIDTEYHSKGSYAKLLSFLYLSSSVIMTFLSIAFFLIYTLK